MARAVSKTEVKATLWDLIVAISGYITWVLIWIFFIWVGMLRALETWGFTQLPQATRIVVFVVATIISIIFSAFCSKWFTDFKNWAKEIELF